MSVHQNSVINSTCFRKNTLFQSFCLFSYLFTYLFIMGSVLKPMPVTGSGFNWYPGSL